MDGLEWKTPIKMDDFGVPPSRHPFLALYWQYWWIKNNPSHLCAEGELRHLYWLIKRQFPWRVLCGIGRGVALDFHEFAVVGDFISAPTTWRQISWFGFGDFLELIQVEVIYPALRINQSLDWLAEVCCFVSLSTGPKNSVWCLGCQCAFQGIRVTSMIMLCEYGMLDNDS